MHEKLILYISGLLKRPLNEAEAEAIESAFKPKKLRKHQYFLQEGEVCRVAGFIVRGAMKQYTVDESGRENILGLFVENWWAGDRESFANDTASPYFIDAFEETEMLIVAKNDYAQTLSQQPFMSELIRTLTERQALQLLKRVHSTKTLTAEQRLVDLENNYPEFLQRFPQHIIASYLGMTKETLSRIRANTKRK